MRRKVKDLLVKLSGNEGLQRLLERSVELSRLLVGIGSGSFADSSDRQLRTTNFLAVRGEARR